MKTQFLKSFNISVTGAALILFISSCCITACTRGASYKKIDAGAVWLVDKTVALKGLTVAEGGAIKAPEGYSVTMTVDGIEMDIAPGDYRGDIVLSVTEEIPITFRNFPEPHIFRTAVYIEDGRYIKDKSVAAAASTGEITDTQARDVRITSKGENFNGIMATGDSAYPYSIINPEISFTGNGGNDFAGFGAAIMSSGRAEVTLDRARIITGGVVRTAVWVGGNSTMHVNDSYLEVHNGVLPADYTFTADAGKMKEVPWMLGITGNCRATNVVDAGAAYYSNTQVKAQAWGALSTDGTRGGILSVTGCTVQTVESGYGAYADGSVTDTFSACRFDVNDYGLIMTGGDGIFTDGTVVNSGRFGVMFHGSANLTIDKGCVFNTGKAVLQVKSAFPTILVDNAGLYPSDGIILQSMVNDDPNKAAMPGGGIPGRGGPMPEGEMPGGGMPDDGAGGGPGGGGNDSTDITATFRNVTLEGDIIHAMTSLADMVINFESATITGAITTATARARADADGVELNLETCYYIGEVINTFGPTGDEFGLKVTLKEGSGWIITDTSYLTSLTIEEGAELKALEGYRVTMTVDDRMTPIGAGEYTGRIVLTVSRS